MRWGLWSPACEPRRRYADGICTRLLRARLGENECLLRRTAPWEVEVPFFVTWPSNAMLLRRMPGFVSGIGNPVGAGVRSTEDGAARNADRTLSIGSQSEKSKFHHLRRITIYDRDSIHGQVLTLHLSSTPPSSHWVVPAERRVS
jgi:hypothetical protein